MRLYQEGTYDATLQEAYMTESGQKGTPGIIFVFKFGDDYIDTTRWVTPNTSERLWADLETLGFTKKHAEDMENLDRLTEICGGHACEIVCEDKEYNGETKLDVKWINPVGGRRSSNGNTKASIHAILNSNSITRPALAGAPRRPPLSPPSSGFIGHPIDKDDIPF
jgi:hypothetical protein